MVVGNINIVLVFSLNITFKTTNTVECDKNNTIYIYLLKCYCILVWHNINTHLEPVCWASTKHDTFIYTVQVKFDILKCITDRLTGAMSVSWWLNVGCMGSDGLVVHCCITRKAIANKKWCVYDANMTLPLLLQKICIHVYVYHKPLTFTRNVFLSLVGLK